jgi:hypothetical protein
VPNDGVVFSSYVTTLDIAFSPNDRALTMVSGGQTFPSYWMRRQYFGDKLRSPWNQDGTNWGPYVGGENFIFESSYMWRGCDYSWYDSSNIGSRGYSFQTDTPGSGAINIDNVSTNYVHARTDDMYFAGKPIMMNKYLNMLNPRNYGANVMKGDGSVKFANNGDWIKAYVVSNGSTAPFEWYPAGGSYLKARLFGMLMYYDDNYKH